MQNNKTSRSPYTKKTENTNTQTLSTPTPKDSPLSKCFQTITELPLRKFIAVAVDHNYAELIISGLPSQEELEEAWFDIYQQYLDAMGDANQMMILKLYREITRLALEQEQIDFCIQILSTFKSETKLKKYEDLLNSTLQTKFKFREKRSDDLTRARRIAKQMSLKIDIKQMQLDNLNKTSPKEGEKISREYFQSVLITLSDFSKYQVQDSITTYEFCERVKRFNTFLQTQKNKK